MISVIVPDRDWSLFAIIMTVVPLSAVINFWQEFRSTAAHPGHADALSNSFVRRRRMDGDSKEVEVSRSDIARGDILSISPGDVIPADCVLLESSNLSISQSRYFNLIWLGPGGC